MSPSPLLFRRALRGTFTLTELLKSDYFVENVLLVFDVFDDFACVKRYSHCKRTRFYRLYIYSLFTHNGLTWNFHVEMSPYRGSGFLQISDK